MGNLSLENLIDDDATSIRIGVDPRKKTAPFAADSAGAVGVRSKSQKWKSRDIGLESILNAD
jgi:hypothetical protein